MRESPVAMPKIAVETASRRGMAGCCSVVGASDGGASEGGAASVAKVADQPSSPGSHAGFPLARRRSLRAWSRAARSSPRASSSTALQHTARLC